MFCRLNQRPRSCARRASDRPGLLPAILWTVAMAVGPVSSHAIGDEPTEYSVKAAFLYNFLNYCEWPKTAFSGTNAPITIGVLGDDPFGTILDEIAKTKTVQGRKLVIRRFKRIADIEASHVLFISASEKGRLSRVLEALGDGPVLTIGETEGFSELGVVINFTMEQNKVRFEINLDAARKAELTISSKLLRLASKIIEKGKKARR